MKSSPLHKILLDHQHILLISVQNCHYYTFGSVSPETYFQFQYQLLKIALIQLIINKEAFKVCFRKKHKTHMQCLKPDLHIVIAIAEHVCKNAPKGI